MFHTLLRQNGGEKWLPGAYWAEAAIVDQNDDRVRGSLPGRLSTRPAHCYWRIFTADSENVTHPVESTSLSARPHRPSTLARHIPAYSLEQRVPGGVG